MPLPTPPKTLNSEQAYDLARVHLARMNPTSIDQYARLGWFKPHGLWFCSGEPTSATREYVPPHLGGGWFDYCCELATKQDGFDASSEWGQRVEWSQELRLDASKILQLRTEDDLLAFVREYGGTAPVGRPPWSSANAEMRDVVQRSSASVNVRNPRLERATAFGSGDIFLGDGLVWSAVAREFGGIEILPYRYDAPWR